jgi:hypothetical protein
MKKENLLSLAIEEKDHLFLLYNHLFDDDIPKYSTTFKLYFMSYEVYNLFLTKINEEIDIIEESKSYFVKTKEGELKKTLGLLIFRPKDIHRTLVAIGGHDDYYGDMLYDLESSSKQVEIIIYMKSDSEEDIEKIIQRLSDLHQKALDESDIKNKIGIELISLGLHNQMKSQPYYIDPISNMDIEFNYGEGFLEKNSLIIEKLNTGKKGLVILNGDPGTGKSTYIKYLMSQVKKTFCLFSVNDATTVDSPVFNRFLSENTNKIIVIEDAEKLVISRDDDDNSSIAGILNLSDGIASELFNIMIILTFNTERKNVDKALLRKGRLICEHEFTKIPLDRAREMIKTIHDIDLDPDINSDFSLTDIYNYNDYEAEEKQKLIIGF